MWIEKTKTGLRLCDRVKINGKIKRISVSLEKDTAQARRKATEALNEKVSHISTPLCQKPLYDLSRLYWETKDVKESTREQNRTTFYSAVDLCGNITVGELDPRKIKQAYTESGKSAKTLNRYLNLLRTFIKWLYEMGYTESDMSSRISFFRDNSPKKAPDQLYLEADELSAVLDQLSGMNKYVCHFLALTGCRIGETAALTMEDVADTHIIVNKTLSHTGILTTAKTQSSTREIFIQQELADLISEYKEWRLLYMMSHGIRTDRFFFGRGGVRLHHATVEAAMRKIDIGKPLHPHILRHTHTALLAEQGVQLEVISRRLGHGDEGITKRIYYHITKKQKERDEELLLNVHIL